MSKYVFYEMPSLPSGYILNPNHSFFSIIVPEETVNLVYNPEVQDLTYYGFVDISGFGGFISLDPTEQHYGHNSISTLLGNNDYIYCEIDPPLTANVPYTASLSIKGSGTLEIFLDDGAGNPIGAIETITATSFWYRWSVTTHIPTPAIHRIVVRSINGFEGNLDAFQLEQKSYATTFCSGRLSGLIINQNPAPYYWTGLEHDSTSVRLNTTRDGGRILPFHDFGFHVTSYEGLTLPDFDNISTPLALQYGSYYYGSTLESRDLEICGRISDCDVKDYFCNRGLTAHSLQPNLTTLPQPLKILYQVYDCITPICQPVEILGVYESGLSGNIENMLGEDVCITFNLFDPYLKLTGNRASDLTEEVDEVALNSPIQIIDGVASEMDEFSGGSNEPYIMGIGPDNAIYVGLQNINFGAGNPEAVYRWNGVDWDLIGEVAGGTGDIYFMHKGTTHYLYVAGDFQSIGNSNGFIAASDYGAIPGPYVSEGLGVAKYNTLTETWETMGRVLTTGVSQPIVYALEIIEDPLSAQIILAVGGFFHAVEDGIGIVANSSYLASYRSWLVGGSYWYGSGTNFAGLTGADHIRCLKVAPDYSGFNYQDLWVGGLFTILGGGPVGEDIENIARMPITGPSVGLIYPPVSGDDTSNLIDGIILAIEVIPSTNPGFVPPRIFACGSFKASNEYELYQADYPPYILDTDTAAGNNYASYSIAELKPAAPNLYWETLGIIGDIDTVGFATVWDMKLDSNNNLHVVGQFDFVNTDEFPEDYSALPFPGGAASWDLLTALSVQVPNCRAYAVWDTTANRWSVPNILIDDGNIYSLVIFEDNIYLGFPDGATSFVSQNSVTIDIECSDSVKPIIYLYGPDIISGSANILSISNITTGAIIEFDGLELVPGEIITLNLSQPILQLTSNIRGDIRSYILPSSSITNFILVPGENQIVITLDTIIDDPITGYVLWKPQYLSIELACECEC